MRARRRLPGSAADPGPGPQEAAAAAPATATAVPASTPKVIQSCGKFLACASHRPRSFRLYRHTRINDIRWRPTATRAVGLGWFGHAKHVCNNHVPAVKDTWKYVGQ